MRNVEKIIFTLVAAVLVVFPLAAIAAPARGTNMRVAFARITADLAANKPASTADAISRINKLISGDPNQCAWLLCNRWAPKLLAEKQYPAVAGSAQRELLSIPSDTNAVEQLLVLRITALLAMGKADVALADARSLFNVCTMRDSANALALIARCLKAASPDGAYDVQQFKHEEIAGAALPALGAPPVACSVLAGVRIHAAPYLRRAWGDLNQQYEDLIARGNLLLLAGHAREARVCMNCAFAVAQNAGQLARAAGRIAACIKAEDGTIGRANAWVDQMARQ